MPKANAIGKDLTTAVQGLLYTSETDAPFEPFAWTGAAGTAVEDAVRANSGARGDAPIEQQTLAQFARTIPDESRGDYAPLFALLKNNIKNVTVVRVGEINIDIYLVGRTADGQFSGVKTKAVET
ncbi:MAG: nuclease A inhibitor family protein [Gemmata sp.]